MSDWLPSLGDGRQPVAGSAMGPGAGPVPIYGW